MQITLKVAPEAEQFVVVCKEFDIVGQGSTIDQAVENFGKTWAGEVELGNLSTIKPPPAQVVNNFFEGAEVLDRLKGWIGASSDELRLRCGELTADEVRLVRAVLKAIAG